MQFFQHGFLYPLLSCFFFFDVVIFLLQGIVFFEDRELQRQVSGIESGREFLDEFCSYRSLPSTSKHRRRPPRIPLPLLVLKV